MKQDISIIEKIIEKMPKTMASTVPTLQAIGRKYGYIPIEAIELLSKKTGIAASHIYGVATFYTQFRLNPVGKHIVKVCHGTACHVAGADGISEAIGETLGISPSGGTTSDKNFTVESVACLGCCSLAPVVMVSEEVHGRLNRTKAEKLIKHYCECEASGAPKTKDPLADISIDNASTAINRILIGLGSCGIASGARPVLELFLNAKNRFSLTTEVISVGCNGMCHKEPLVELIDKDGIHTLYGGVDIVTAKKILTEHVLSGRPVKNKIVDEASLRGDNNTPSPRPAVGWTSLSHAGEREIMEKGFLSKQHRIVLENCGKINPESIDEYEKTGGYSALKKVLSDNKPEELISAITASGLRGRGGAGFSTGKKWQFARAAKGDEKYIICNADEGDPGAFMDRSVLESDPHRVIEGMIIAAFAIGAAHGYIYCRAEYPLAVKRLQIAINAAKERGYLGQKILGNAFSLDIEIKEGAGAFVCGEETALIASLEGKRGMPRIRPPYPAIAGLFGKPTNINNVETFANVPWIITHGADKFAAMGTATSKGSKVFALAGDIKFGGLVEVPMGITIREIIEGIGGGTTSGLPVKAVQLGGPSGGCIPARLMNTVVDYEAVNATGAIMGSGGMVVMDESACMVDIARFFLNFTQDESCGKCTFCRIGTRRMLEILTNICEGKGKKGDLELLEELANHICNTSLCALGQTAPNPVLTTIKYFREEFEAHINHGKCPAGKCRALITYSISEELCTGCTACARVCPTKCITGEKKKAHHINDADCTRCGACKQICPVKAVIVG